MNEWEWQLLEEKMALDCLEIAGVRVRAGDRVRLHPCKGGDVLDIALAGQTATIEALEQDYEGKFHVCVVLDNDPGRDMGLLRQPGHRFFFDPEEVEPMPKRADAPDPATAKPGILIAGIGNIFLGDDGFGVEVVRRLAARQLPAGVRVADFGIRGFDLAYALQDGYRTTVLVDAFPHGQEPGTVSIIEPDLDGFASAEWPGGGVETHGMNPMNVLRMAVSMGASLKGILLVGCEPATLGPEEGQMGLSEPVEKAVDEAVNLLDSVITKILAGNWPTQRCEPQS
jgi:hydrogenase maturation protease